MRSQSPIGCHLARVLAQTRCHLAPSGAMWREISLAQLGARHYIPVDFNRRIVCATGRSCSRHLVPLGGHLALITRCKWRDEDFKHFAIFLPSHSNLLTIRVTTSQLGGSLSKYTPLGTLLATLGTTVNCIGANWHQLALAQWTPSIIRDDTNFAGKPPTN